MCHEGFALQQTYCEHDYGSNAIEFEWIAIDSDSTGLSRWKGSSFCDFEIGLIVIWMHLSSVFGIFDFFVFWRG